MAYSIFPNSIPPANPKDYDAGSYAANYNAHISDKNMNVDAYSFDQGVGRELSCILNFINKHNLGTPTSKIVSGYFYQIGSSGQSDWFNTSTPLENFWCKSGYINNYHPVNATYDTIIVSGANLYINNLLTGPTDLDIIFSGHLNDNSNYYVTPSGTNIELFSGTFYAFQLNSGVVNVYSSYQKSSYPALSLHGKLNTDFLHIYSGVMNSSGLYINAGNQISGYYGAIIFDPRNGHNHTGTINNGTKITSYVVTTTSGFWDLKTKKYIKDANLNLKEYTPKVNSTWTHNTNMTNVQDIIKFKDNLYVFFRSSLTTGPQYVNKFKMIAYSGTVTQAGGFDSNDLSMEMTIKPTIIRNNLVVGGAVESVINVDRPIRVLYHNNTINTEANWNVLNITVNESEDSWPTMSGKIFPEYIIDYKEKLYIFGYQWNGLPKIIYGDNFADTIWEIYDENNVQEITMKLKNPVIYDGELYFADYANNIYKIKDHNTSLEYVLSTTPSGKNVQNIGDYYTRSWLGQPAYFDSHFFKHNVYHTSSRKLADFNNEDFNITTFTDRDGERTSINYKDTLFIQGTDGTYRTTTNLASTIQDTTNQYSTMMIYKDNLYGFSESSNSVLYKKNNPAGTWTSLGLQPAVDTITKTMTVYSGKMYISASEGPYTKLYSSSDGTNWTLDLTRDNEAWGTRIFNNLIPFNNGLYVSYKGSGIYNFIDADTTEMVVDGDCESLTGWTETDNGVIALSTNLPYEGTFSIYVDCTGGADTCGIEQTINCTAGDKYRIVAYVKNNDLGDGGDFESVKMSADGNIAETSSDGIWEELILEFTASSSSFTLKFYRYLDDDTFKIDNVSCTLNKFVKIVNNYPTVPSEGTMTKFNNKLYFLQMDSSDHNTDLWSLDTNDNLALVSGNICKGEATFGVHVYNNKLLYGTASGGPIVIDNTFETTGKNWRYYDIHSELFSGNYINLKNKLLGPCAFYTNIDGSGAYFPELEMIDSKIINGQLYYADKNRDLYKIINNEKIKLFNGSHGSKTLRQRNNNRLIETFNGKLFFVDKDGKVYYRDLNINDTYLDVWSEEL